MWKFLCEAGQGLVMTLWGLAAQRRDEGGPGTRKQQVDSLEGSERSSIDQSPRGTQVGRAGLTVKEAQPTESRGVCGGGGGG